MNGLDDFTGFLKGQSASVDVNAGIDLNLTFYKFISIVLVVVGIALLGIYVLRQVAAMAYIITMNGGGSILDGDGFGGKVGGWIKKMAPGSAQSAATPWEYMKSNMKDIILTFICIYLIFSLTIFNVVSICMSGLAYVFNRIMNLDIAYYESAMDASAFSENVPKRRTQDLYTEYNREIPKIQQNLEQLYSMQGATDADNKYTATKTAYTRAMVRAEVVAKELNSRQAAVKELGIAADSFEKHKKTSGEYGMCNSAFFAEDIMVRYGVTVSCDS